MSDVSSTIAKKTKSTGINSSKQIRIKNGCTEQQTNSDFQIKKSHQDLNYHSTSEDQSNKMVEYSEAQNEIQDTQNEIMDDQNENNNDTPTRSQSSLDDINIHKNDHKLSQQDLQEEKQQSLAQEFFSFIQINEISGGESQIQNNNNHNNILNTSDTFDHVAYSKIPIKEKIMRIQDEQAFNGLSYQFYNQLRIPHKEYLLFRKILLKQFEISASQKGVKVQHLLSFEHKLKQLDEIWEEIKKEIQVCIQKQRREDAVNQNIKNDANNRKLFKLDNNSDDINYFEDPNYGKQKLFQRRESMPFHSQKVNYLSNNSNEQSQQQNIHIIDQKEFLNINVILKDNNLQQQQTNSYPPLQQQYELHYPIGNKSPKNYSSPLRVSSPG